MSDPHLDDETISALFDGENGTEDAASRHLAQCEQCLARFGRCEAVPRLMATATDPLDDDVASRMVDAALGAFAGPPAVPRATVVPLRPRRPPLVWLASAA